MSSKPRITNKLPQFISKVQVQAAKGMTRALVLGASEASVLTPIHLGNLLNSQYKSVENRDGKIVGTVGYTANYALPVHDPAHPQKFRRATAEKLFLQKGMERAAPSIKAVLTGAIKTK